MRPGPLDRLNFQRVLADTRLPGRKLYALIPDLERLEVDPLTESGEAPTYGDGSGQEVVNWRVYAFYANVRNVDQALLTFGAAPPGAVVGDVYLTIGLRDKPMLEAVYQHEHAYLAIDGDPFRPTSFAAAGVGHIEEWIINLVRYAPVFRADGY